MTDHYQVIRDALPILIAEAQAKGGRNQRAALIVELLEERDALQAENERLREDAERLDWLDAQNARKNGQNGTRYGWGYSENHNRIALEDHQWPPRTVREAIDHARRIEGDGE